MGDYLTLAALVPNSVNTEVDVVTADDDGVAVEAFAYIFFLSWPRRIINIFTSVG